MTVWQIIASAAVLLVLLTVVYRAGQSAGESQQRVTSLRNPTDEKIQKDYLQGELLKERRRGNDWLAAYSKQRSECQKLNKALAKRNRTISALRKRSHETVSEEPPT